MSCKAKKAAKQKIAALSYPELLTKQEYITSRLSEIGIENVNINGGAASGTAGTAGTAGGADAATKTGGGRRGRRRKRTGTNTSTLSTPPPDAPLLVNANHSTTAVTATASATATATNDNINVGEGVPTQQSNDNTTKNESPSSSLINNKTATEDNNTSQIKQDDHNNATITTQTPATITTATTTTTIISPPSKIPFNPKTDVQWDFLLAEMKWLSADFQSERKRHTSLARKQSTSMKQFIRTKEKRQMQKLVQMELKRRKLSNKIARDVIKGWWDNKINRIIAYKQKVDAELIKKRSMDRHLIQLVKQTERYSDLIVRNEDIDGASHSISKTNNMSIEEALQQSDYESKIQKEEGAKSVNDDNDKDEYHDESKGDNSHDPDVCMSSSQDDQNDQHGNDNAIQIDQHENGSSTPIDTSITDSSTTISQTGIQTRNRRIKIKIKSTIDGADNDSGSNNSIQNDEKDDQEEFKPLHELDDETTIEAEEKLGRDMSYQEEIDLLTKEGEMSVEELRAMYYGREEEEKEGQMNDEDENDNVEDHNISDDMSEQTDVIDNLNRNESQSIDEESTIQISSSSDEMAQKKEEESESEDFTISEMPVDDETTIQEEEKLGRDMSYEDEIALLTQENEMSIDELKAKYYGNDALDDDQNENDSKSDEQQTDDDVLSLKEESNNNSLTKTFDPFAVNDDAPEDEFKPSGELGLEVDDETTIEAEERLGRDMSYEDEIALLKRENELSLEDLKKMYMGISDVQSQTSDHEDSTESTTNDVNHKDENASIHNILNGDIADASSRDENDEEDFIPEKQNEVDDETTIEAEERLGREMSYEEEIELLKRESEMSVEELQSLYMNDGVSRKRRSRSAQLENENYSKRIKKEEIGCNDEASKAIRSLEMADARARNTTASRPFLLAPWVKLRAYQQIGLNWLVSTQTRRLNAILADEMGLGKTLQTISLLSYLACYKGIWGPHLIIVPTSCIVNWEMELKRFAPALKVLCYYGSAKRRKELRQGWTKTNWHHVIITSYQIVVQDSFAFKRKKWYYLILDEAHNIKNFQSQRWQTLINFNTQRRLLLTGTPLQNNLMELWSLLHFLMPYIFRSRKEFSQWFSNPMNNIIEGNTNRNDDLINRLHGIIRPFVLRRLKKDVETQMPGKFEHIVMCSLSRRQMFLYEEFMARSSTRMALEKGSNYMGMMNVLMQLRKVCNHPDLFEPRSIETPFFVDSLSFATAGCVANAVALQSPFDCVSPHLSIPMWSLGSGLPSIHTCMKYDKITVEIIKRLMPSTQDLVDGFCDRGDLKSVRNDKLKPGLQLFLNNILDATRSEKEHSARVQSSINSWRCQSQPFPFPIRTIKATQIEPKFPTKCIDDLSQLQIASTPAELLQMKKSYEERENDLEELMKKFVFYVPKATASTPKMYAKDYDVSFCSSMLRSKISSQGKSSSKLMLQDCNTPFFPDKKLVQFDAGKLQTLSELLRSLKQGRHRVLIFTQMSKMLDILEVFLNLNGHTYLRLDGSTGVEQRQRLMDRFNNDEKIFCFILSTRSGGLGINLTGADTVVFYDSDWNPAMDAQAQDRAHRIGQTRDVHIYRLVTQHTIEENILVKAKQKRHLDFLVMDEGKFHASEQQADRESDNDQDSGAECGIGTKSGLRNILGLSNESKVNATDGEVSKDELESAMATLEDEDDVKAMRGAQQEAAEELEEFDEGVKIKQETDNDEDDAGKSNTEEKKETIHTPPASSEAESEEAKLEKEFLDWQRQVGADKASIDASLNPVERYALKFREEIEPFYSMWYMPSQEDGFADTNEDEVDIEEIESMKAQDEYYAIEDGDLLATLPSISDLPHHRSSYYKEKSRIQANKRRRKLTGENWTSQIDGKTKYPFWYNDDTGEAIWDKPKILIELDEFELAERNRWNAVPAKPLILVMNFLLSYPDRMACALVCKKWRAAAQDFSFVHHVYPVEMGALSMNPKKMEKNHYRTISEALSFARAGDTIELGDGHYWLNDHNIVIDYPLRIIGDEKDPSHVVVEVSGTIQWKASSGYIEGVTFRKPRINSRVDEMPNMFEISGGLFHRQCALVGNYGQKGIQVKTKCSDGNGIVMKDFSRLSMTKSQISNHQGSGIIYIGDQAATIQLKHCSISDNNGPGIVATEKCHVVSENCTLV